jgi:hypothetical protein
LLAKYAQHAVLMHFPLALFIAEVVFDFLAQKTKKRGLLEAAYYNLPGAAIFALPAVVTGILARQLQLEGQKKTQRHFAYVCGAGFDVDDPHLGGLGTARVYQTTLAKKGCRSFVWCWKQRPC